MNNRILTRQTIWLLALLHLLLLMAGTPPVRAEPAATARLYSSPTGVSSGTCATWATACKLWYALNRATAPAEIWVKKGTHKPTTTNSDPRQATFQLKTGVAVYGGFVGTETALARRNWKINVTLLSGDIGAAGDTSDNSYHVVTGSGTDRTAILDGFRVKFGNANASGCPGGGCGGGMFNYVGSPTVRNVIFDSNQARWGAGMMNWGSGGIGSSPLVNDVTFSNNSATTVGGGMYNVNDSSPSLTNVTFTGNSAQLGGGMENDYVSAPTLTNVTFNGNQASTAGGGLHNNNYAATSTLTNVTMSGNSPQAIYLSGGGVIFKNGIVWNGGITPGINTATITSSVVQNGCPAGASCTGLVTGDPKLQLLANNGGATQTMALGAGSSAINVAYTADCPSTDQRGKPRRKGGGYCDIGAYEAQPSNFTALGGISQSTLIKSQFPALLLTEVKDVFGNGLAGLPITFLAPASGASATLNTSGALTNTAGRAFAIATANSTPGSYAVTAKAPILATVLTFHLTNASTLENEHIAISYDKWTGARYWGASGSTWRYNPNVNSSVTFRFTGTSVTWVTVMCVSCGTANVTIDGINKGNRDLFSMAVVREYGIPFNGLANTSHTMVINVLENQPVYVDAFKVGSTTTQDLAAKVQYGSWKGVTSAYASGGNYRVSDTTGATTTLSFTGTSITWVTAKGPAMGQAEVRIDGGLPTTEDLYWPTAVYKVPKTYSGLAAGPHTIEIKVAGTHNVKSTGYKVVVDGFKGPIVVN